MNMNKYERLNQQKKYRSENSFQVKSELRLIVVFRQRRRSRRSLLRVSAIFFDVTLSKRKNGSFIKFLRMKGFRGRVRRSGNSLIR